MKAALKISGLLIGFLLFLSVTINGKPIFNYVYDAISPATKYAQNATQDFFGRSMNSTEVYSKKLFDNSVPKVKDSVKSKLSSTLKKAVAAEPEEKIMESEKKELDQLIKNH
jgi:hypothetical protein